MAGTVHIDIIQGGRPVGHAHVHPGAPFEVGREGASCRVNDGAMSARHFRLVEVAGSLTLEDLASSNGTFLNGVQVATTAVVVSGDRVRAGDTDFLLNFERPGPMRIEGTLWRVTKTPPGFATVPHLGLQAPRADDFIESVICKEDKVPPRTGLAEYVESQFAGLRAHAPDIKFRQLGAAPQFEADESWVGRVGFTYQGRPINQMHIYLRHTDRVGVACWSFARPHDGENQRFAEILGGLAYG